MSSSAVLPSIGGYTISGGTDLWHGDFGKRRRVSLAFWLLRVLSGNGYRVLVNVQSLRQSFLTALSVLRLVWRVSLSRGCLSESTCSRGFHGHILGAGRKGF